MFSKIWMGIALFSIFTTFGYTNSQVEQPRVDTPRAGETVSGVVAISGSTDISGFQSYQIDFSLQDDPNHPWFSITSSATTVRNGPLGSWDTRSISDGSYKLRVRVYLTNHSFSDLVIEPIIIRNKESDASVPVSAVLAPTSTSSVPSEPTMLPLTATPLSPNPATISTGGILTSIATGIAFTIIAFIGLGVFIWMNNRNRIRK